MANVTEREYYTVSEAAEVLGVSRTTIWRWIESGRLPAYRVGGKTIRIRRADLPSLLKPARGTRSEAGTETGPHTIELRDTDVWADYDAKKVREALRNGAGALAGIDRAGTLRDIHGGREQASHGRPM